MRSDELRRQRAMLVTEARSVLERADPQSHGLSQEDETRYQALDADIERLSTQIDRHEAQEAREAEMGQRLNDPVPSGPTGREDGQESNQRQRAEGPFEIRGTDGRAERDWRFWLPPSPRAGADREVHERAWVRFLRGVARTEIEARALQADDDEAGGYTVPPEEFVARLIKFVDDSVYIRQFATVMTVTRAESLGVPSLDADPADADWTTELATGSEDSTMDFGKRQMEPHPLAKRLKVSKKLLRVSALDVQSLVLQRLAYKFGITEEKGFLTGTGAGQPLGLFTASANGIPTTRDVSTDNTTTAITADGLVNAKYSCKEAYMRSGRWIFHRDAVKMIRKLKDGEGQYLWQPGLSGGQPSTIIDSPYLMSEYAPNTFTTGLYVGLFGDLSFYWIVDSLALTIQRLIELYAESNQDGFIGRLECDGQPVLGEAFARVKLA